MHEAEMHALIPESPQTHSPESAATGSELVMDRKHHVVGVEIARRRLAR